MNTRTTHCIHWLMAVIFAVMIAVPPNAHAVSSCCGKSSSSNPYPCSCGKANTGNCTWYAWYKAKKEWNKSLPKWGDAGKWASGAKGSKYPVSSTPKKDRIGVNTYVDGYGHVAWVTSVSGNYVKVKEMNWCSTCERSKTYPKYWFNGGYIAKK